MSDIQKRLDQQRNEQQENFKQKMIEKGEEYFNLIVKEPVEEIKRLPESTFVKSFLPYFCGEQLITDKTNVMALWIGIAGSITSKVHIVNTKDEIVFTVPPINDTSIFDVINKNQGQNFKNIVLNYKLYANQTPMSAQNYLNRTLDQRLDKLRSSSEVFNQNEKTWKDIFIRYGKIPADSIIETKKKTSLDDDELVYD